MKSSECTVVCVACVYAERVRGCEGDDNAGMGNGGGVVVISAWHVGVTRGSGSVSRDERSWWSV